MGKLLSLKTVKFNQMNNDGHLRIIVSRGLNHLINPKVTF